MEDRELIFGETDDFEDCSAEGKNYYLVTAKCGHVGGKHCYTSKIFAVTADSGKAAAALVRGKPRVKHDQKDAILSCRKVGYEEYRKQKTYNRFDPYFSCKSIQEQNNYPEIYQHVSFDTGYKPTCKYDEDKRIAKFEKFGKTAAKRLNLKRAARYGYGKKERFCDYSAA